MRHVRGPGKRSDPQAPFAWLRVRIPLAQVEQGTFAFQPSGSRICALRVKNPRAGPAESEGLCERKQVWGQ